MVVIMPKHGRPRKRKHSKRKHRKIRPRKRTHKKIEPRAQRPKKQRSRKHIKDCYRNHLSGQRYLVCNGRHCRFAIKREPKRRGLITLSKNTYFNQMHGDPMDLNMQWLWRLCSKREIIQKLDTLCPGHRVTMSSWNKVPMLKKWLEYEQYPLRTDKVLIAYRRKFTDDQLDHLSGTLSPRR